MHAEVSYRQVVLKDKAGAERLRVPLLAPLNDVLGESVDKPESLVHLNARYRGLFPRGSLAQVAPQAGAFRAAAKAAAGGRLHESLAPHLSRLRFQPDGTLADAPDLLALAAWTLLEALRTQPLKLYTCPRCKRPWLGTIDEKSRFCQRPAPGQGTKDCRTFEYERRAAGDTAYRAYRREYKRVTEMHRRGAIDLYQLYRWREHNSPSAWSPYEQRKEDNDG